MNTRYMEIALDEARKAAERGEVPVGAVVVRGGEVLAQTGNRTAECHDPSAHAEILAMRLACESLQNQRLIDCDLYVTLEPCNRQQSKEPVPRITSAGGVFAFEHVRL